MKHSILGNFHLYPYDRLDSTNTQAERLLTSGQDFRQPALIWALEQEKGRGRQGRQWHSPLGNLYATFVFPHLKPTLPYPLLSLASSIAVLEAIKDLSQSMVNPPVVEVKWPNDILLNGCKIAGLLLETVTSSTSHSAVLVGIGVNVQNSPSLSTTMLYPPTSLRAENIQEITVFQVLNKIQGYLWEWYQRWLKGHREFICTTWQEHMAFTNEPIEVNCTTAPLKGIFKGINQDGHMILETLNGQKQVIMIGDVLRLP